MAANGSSPVENDNGLDRIKRQLAAGSGRNLLQGPLLKRSETLHKWNERWMILDPTTGKMEYKTRRNEPAIKGAIVFDANSTITISPVNFHGLPKYEGCCFCIHMNNIPLCRKFNLDMVPICCKESFFVICLNYCCSDIGTPQKKDYFLCAETPGAARAWVSTLHAAQLVLKAHREAVNSLSGNGSARLGTVATVVAAANSTAAEASKEIEAAMQISMKAALNVLTNKTSEGQMDDLSIMKETLRVKDEELQHLAREIRARDATIKEIAEKLTDTAEAAEAAASAAHTMDEGRRAACAEIERLRKEAEQQLESSLSKLRVFEERMEGLSKERDQLLKQRDSALQEAQLWRSELAKAREHAVILEAAVVRADERVRVAEADAGAKVKDALEKEMAAMKEKEDLLAYVKLLQSQLQRQPVNVAHVFEGKTESCSNADTTPPLTKHVDSLESNVDKPCLSVSKSIPVAVEQNFRAVGETEWSDFQVGGARIADVREISPEGEGNSMDIPVVSPGLDGNNLSGGSSQP